MIVKVNGKDYPLGDLARIDLGEARMLKRILGQPLHTVVWDERDPDHIAAFVWLALDRNSPTRVPLEQVEQLRPGQIEIVPEDTDPEPEGETKSDPPPAEPAAETNGDGPHDGASSTPVTSRHGSGGLI